MRLALHPSTSNRLMKQIVAPAFLSLMLLGSIVAAPPANPQEQLLAAVKEVQAQQALMAENQAKIEAKLATVAEAVRVARIYSSRGGG